MKFEVDTYHYHYKNNHIENILLQSPNRAISSISQDDETRDVARCLKKQAMASIPTWANVNFTLLNVEGK